MAWKSQGLQGVTQGYSFKPALRGTEVARMLRLLGTLVFVE